MNEPNTVWIKVFTPGGFQASVTIAFDNLETLPQAGEVEKLLARAGYSAAPAGLQPGQEKEIILTVIRRQTNNDKSIVDFYPAWSAGGKYGVHKYAHFYIDDDADIAEFEARTGLKFADLPVLNSDTPLRRTFEKRHACEVDVKRPLEIVRTQNGEHDTGMPKYEYSYFGTVPGSAESTPVPATAPAVPTSVEKPLSWLNDGKQTDAFKQQTGMTPGVAAQLTGKPVTSFETPAALIEALAAASKPAEPKGEAASTDDPFAENS